MKIYMVGGAVRDELLGLPVADRDFVVVGATPEEMVARGFLPVGKDFPVFLHPVTHEEYALARTERKSGRGYKGFTVYASPEVTLEEDLARRDLTINAIAKDEAGHYIDPYGGRQDLERRVLRHVSPAFVEDPVRILRVARFAARFTDFTVAQETRELMRQMVANGEVDALVPERVWLELARGLMEKRPSRMFEVLRDCGALARILPEVDRLFGVPQNPKSHPEVDTGDHVLRVVDRAAARGSTLAVRFAALTHDLGKGETPRDQWPFHDGHEERGVKLVLAVATRLRVPHDCRDLGVLVARWHGEAHRADEADARQLVTLLMHLDAFRQPQRFALFLQACEADYQGRPGYEERAMPGAARLAAASRAAAAVDAGAIARQHSGGEAIRAAIFAARVAAVAAALSADTEGR
jgi:tRNA nucleotidyltransferase (CCA-adding enzyme)